jgi:hypothetical protein
MNPQPPFLFEVQQHKQQQQKTKAIKWRTCGDFATQTILSKAKSLDSGEARELHGNGSFETVARKIESGDIGQLAQFRWNCALQ